MRHLMRKQKNQQTTLYLISFSRRAALSIPNKYAGNSKSGNIKILKQKYNLILLHNGWEPVLIQQMINSRGVSKTMKRQCNILINEQ